jgi:peptide/nickel transport system substrate-binding protein
LADAVAIDKYTVDIHLVKKTGIALNELTGVMMMNKAWLAEHNALKPTDISQHGGLCHQQHQRHRPVILQSRQRDTQMVLVRNPNWWNAAHGGIDKIVFKPVASDATRLSGLLAGEYDLVTSVPLQDIPRLQNNPQITMQISPSLRVDYFKSNLRDKLNAKNDKADNPLKDLRVRQALLMAINRDAITQKVMRGLTKPTTNYLAPDIPGYNAAARIFSMTRKSEGTTGRSRIPKRL